MIHYKYRGRLMVAVASWGLGGVLAGSIMGCLIISVLADLLSGEPGGSIGELLFFSLGIIAPCLILLAGCIRCTAITAQEDGLIIRTCFFLRFFVPWQDVVDIWSYVSFSPTARQRVRQSLVLIRRGLTPLHRSLPRKGPQGWQWPRGFIITAEAQGYSDLVRVIEEHVGGERDLRKFYKLSK